MAIAVDQSKFADQPPEILISIFELAGADSLSAIARVRRSWRDAVQILVERWAADAKLSGDRPANAGMFGYGIISMHTIEPTTEEVLAIPISMEWPWQIIIHRWMTPNSFHRAIFGCSKWSRGSRRYYKRISGKIKVHAEVMRRALDDPSVALIIADEYVRSLQHAELIFLSWDRQDLGYMFGGKSKLAKAFKEVRWHDYSFKYEHKRLNPEEQQLLLISMAISNRLCENRDRHEIVDKTKMKYKHSQALIDAALYGDEFGEVTPAAPPEDWVDSLGDGLGLF